MNSPRMAKITDPAFDVMDDSPETAGTNMNTKAAVQLTSFGAEVYNQHYAGMPEDFRPKRAVEGDILTTELWQLFQIFGSCMYNGMPKVPFEGNLLNIRYAQQ